MSSLIAYAFANNGDIRDRLLVALYDRDAKKFLSCFKKTEKTIQEFSAPKYPCSGKMFK